jgi:lipopolysaccharide assembly protein A
MAAEPRPAPETTPVRPGPGPGEQERPLPQHRIRRTRASGTWAAVVCFAVVLLLLLIFILQNSHAVDLSFFGAHGHLPLGVAMLLAAVCGVLLVALPGVARIVQLRVTARRHRGADAQAVDARRS